MRGLVVPLLAAAVLVAPGLASASTLRADLMLATPTGPGASIGSVLIADGPSGATLTLDLHGLPPGQHGLHVHQNGSCQPSTAADGNVVPAGAAGGHFDPAMSGHHMGPEGSGHLGDLPRLDVGADGTLKATLAAPRVKDATVFVGHALMLHLGGDTYSDTPPLGGGGARFACGVLD